MQHLLNDFWLTAAPIDFEYKRYIMLAYEQRMLTEYKKKKVYPSLTDIVDRLAYVNDFLKNMVAFERSSMEIQKVDWLKQEIHYKTKINDDTFDEIKRIAIMARDILADLYIQFKNLYDEIDGSIVISGSRFSIFDKYEGYLQIKYDMGLKEKIMKYDIYKVLEPEPTFHLRTGKPTMAEYYSDRFQKNIFEIRMNEDYPAKESAIPVFRRKFLLHVMGNYML